jgi:hypothetical protein
MQHKDTMPVEWWYALFQGGEDDVSVAETLLKNVLADRYKFSAENTMNVVNLMTACRLHQLKRDITP